MLHQNWGDPQQDKFIFISKGRLKKNVTNVTWGGCLANLLD